MTGIRTIGDRTLIPLDVYLQKVKEYEPLESKQLLAFIERYQQGEREVIVELTNPYLDFVVSVAKDYQDQGLGLVNLINEGNRGLVMGAKRFDPKAGFSYISFSWWWVRMFMLAAIGNHMVIQGSTPSQAQRKAMKIAKRYDSDLA